MLPPKGAACILKPGCGGKAEQVAHNRQRDGSSMGQVCSVSLPSESERHGTRHDRHHGPLLSLSLGVLLPLALFASLAGCSDSDDGDADSGNRPDLPVTATLSHTSSANSSPTANVEDPSQQVPSNADHQVTATTDRTHYTRGDKVTIVIENSTAGKTFVWLGFCSLSLENHQDERWESIKTDWPLCHSCGEVREIPPPVFIRPAQHEELEWHQAITWCEGNVAKTEQALGTYRFSLRYAEDTTRCSAAQDKTRCWLDYAGKEWQTIYSNAFTIR